MSDHITPRYETVPIFKPDDQARLIELEEAVEKAREDARKGQKKDEPTSVRTLDEDSVESAEAAYREFYEEATGRADAVVKVRNVGNKKWREIRRKYPPEDGNAMDSILGFSAEDAFDDVVAACMVSPTFETDEDRAAFIDAIPYGQWGAVAMAATRVNQDGRLPKAPTALS